MQVASIENKFGGGADSLVWRKFSATHPASDPPSNSFIGIFQANNSAVE
jgi:hypothetical protein